MVPSCELLGVVFIDFVESQLPLTSVVAVLFSNGVVNFSISGKGEMATEAVTLCADSSVASGIVADGGRSVVTAIVDFPSRQWAAVSFLVTVASYLCVFADSATGAVVPPHAIVPLVSVRMVSEALSSVETFGSVSATVDAPTGGATVSLGVERTSLPAAVDIGVVFSRKVVSLNSGSVVTDAGLETVEKLTNNHETVELDRAVVYLSVVPSAVIRVSATGVASLSEGASGGKPTGLVVDGCSALEAPPWNASVSRVWSGLEAQVASPVESSWAPASVMDVGPDSYALTVEADLVEFKEGMFPPSVGVFWVCVGPGVVGGSTVSATVAAGVTPGVEAGCVVSASLTVCTS